MLLNENFVSAPILFNSCDWNWNVYYWKSNEYYAHGLYAKRRSQYMTDPIKKISFRISVKVEYVFEKIAKKLRIFLLIVFFIMIMCIII